VYSEWGVKLDMQEFDTENSVKWLFSALKSLEHLFGAVHKQMFSPNIV
jgi:hypothetical protein